jgi:hypothetical protein
MMGRMSQLTVLTLAVPMCLECSQFIEQPSTLPALPSGQICSSRARLDLTDSRGIPKGIAI